MRRRTLALAALVVLSAAACGGKDDVEGEGDDRGVETAAPTADLADAVALAQRSMPLALPDSRVGILLEDLCASSDVTEQLRGVGFADQGQVDAAVAALGAGTDELCPGEVAPASLDELAAAAAPAPAAAVDPAAAAAAGTAAGFSASGAGGGGSSAAATSGAGSSSAASSSGGGSSGGAANTSSGSADVGGGNATGTGNQSSTGFSQSVGSSGASNSASSGTP